MIRTTAQEKHFGWEENFRWRAGEITRLEGFSDAVFAFAVTLLVVSLEVPHTFEELMDAMRGFAAFALCFAMLSQVWFHHYRYFRRYGLQDTTTVILNGVLLFVVLFYVYPLKFLFTMLIGQLTGGASVGGRTAVEAMISREEISSLMVIYGIGFAAVFGIFAVLAFRAWQRREQLELSPVEEVVTQQSLWENVAMAAIGLLSVLLAIVLPAGMAGLSGFAYFLIPIFFTFAGMHFGRRIRMAKQRVKQAHSSE